MTTALNRDTPVRDGVYYCAPFCCNPSSPHRCAWADYQAAQAAAKDLADAMGVGWEPWVHENLGWHWKVLRMFENGVTTVYRSKNDGAFHCLLTTQRELIGTGRWVGSGASPQEAIDRAFSELQAEAESESLLVREMRRAEAVSRSHKTN